MWTNKHNKLGGFFVLSIHVHGCPQSKKHVSFVVTAKKAVKKKRKELQEMLGTGN